MCALFYKLYNIYKLDITPINICSLIHYTYTAALRDVIRPAQYLNY